MMNIGVEGGFKPALEIGEREGLAGLGVGERNPKPRGLARAGSW
jgi:hypothetical protein